LDYFLNSRDALALCLAPVLASRKEASGTMWVEIRGEHCGNLFTANACRQNELFGIKRLQLATTEK
jgi:hypothetical protein